MKKLLLLLFVILFTNFTSLAQCSINPYIQDNYELDAKILALRDILEDPSDPDFDNPFLPNERVIPYLEKLSAIYENPNNDPEIDMIFNDFNIHVNQAINFQIGFKTLTFSVSTSLTWVEDFINTGISGVTELDNLMSTYEFALDNFNQLNSCSCTHFYIKTDYDFLNLYALIDDFEALNDIESVYVINDAESSLGLNYTGITYSFYAYDEYDVPFGPLDVEACDIIVEDDEFTFSLYGDDCFSGCVASEDRYVTVTSNCVVLSNSNIEFNNFSIYPNPTNNHINIISNNIQDQIVISIFDITGKQVLKSNLIESTLDVSMLNSGIYIIKIDQNNKVETKKLVIK